MKVQVLIVALSDSEWRKIGLGQGQWNSRQNPLLTSYLPLLHWNDLLQDQIYGSEKSSVPESLPLSQQIPLRRIHSDRRSVLTHPMLSAFFQKGSTPTAEEEKTLFTHIVQILLEQASQCCVCFSKNPPSTCLPLSERLYSTSRILIEIHKEGFGYTVLDVTVVSVDRLIYCRNVLFFQACKQISIMLNIHNHYSSKYLSGWMLLMVLH